MAPLGEVRQPAAAAPKSDNQARERKNGAKAAEGDEVQTSTGEEGQRATGVVIGALLPDEDVMEQWNGGGTATDRLPPLSLHTDSP